MSYPELKQSYIFDFYADLAVVTLNKYNVTGIHSLQMKCKINNEEYDNNCRITTNKGYIIEVLKNQKNYIYRLIYEDVKIKNIIQQYGTLAQFNELMEFLNFIKLELSKKII